MGSDSVHLGDDLLESVRLYLSQAPAATVETPTEIIERALAIRELANLGIDSQPDERAFVVVVGRAAPGVPSAPAVSAHGRGGRGAFKRPPSPASSACDFSRLHGR